MTVRNNTVAKGPLRLVFVLCILILSCTLKPLNLEVDHSSPVTADGAAALQRHPQGN